MNNSNNIKLHLLFAGCLILLLVFVLINKFVSDSLLSREEQNESPALPDPVAEGDDLLPGFNPVLRRRDAGSDLLDHLNDEVV